jgi:hypothetical protein
MRALYTDRIAERLVLDVAIAMVGRARRRLDRAHDKLHAAGLAADSARASLERWCEIAEDCARRLDVELPDAPGGGVRIESLRRPER